MFVHQTGQNQDEREMEELNQKDLGFEIIKKRPSIPYYLQMSREYAILNQVKKVGVIVCGPH